MNLSFRALDAGMMIAMKLPTWMGKKFKVMKKTKELLGRLNAWFRNEYVEHEKTWEPDYSR